MTGGRRVRAALTFFAPFALLTAAPSLAQTAAGTTIVNVAELRHGPPDAQTTVRSNSVALRVDATIDLAIVARDATTTVAPAATDVPVAFDITNQGNAPATFTLTAVAAGQPMTVAADSDGDGNYDPARDRGVSVTLTPGQTARAFAILPGPVATEVRVAMTATSTVGTGTPGTVLPDAGPDGVDAVIGPSGGRATAGSIVVVGAVQPALVKSQSVLAPDGSNRVIPGAIVTYMMEARLTAPMRGVVIADPVPAGTTYVAGSITLDGVALSDATAFADSNVRVTIGDVAAATTRTIRFQTKIN